MSGGSTSTPEGDADAMNKRHNVKPSPPDARLTDEQRELLDIYSRSRVGRVPEAVAAVLRELDATRAVLDAHSRMLHPGSNDEE